MYCVYFLRSGINNDLYVGSTGDLQKRLTAHNNGVVRSTKAHRPWKLLGYKECQTRSEAVRLEKFFKNHQQRDLIKRKYGVAT